MRLVALISGGKDSIYAAYLAKKAGHEVVCAITMVSDNPDSYMWHVPNVELTEMQAELMGIPLIQVATEGKKEIELDDLTNVLSGMGSRIDGVVSGAVASKYQMSRIERIASDLGMACVAPLWQQEPIGVLHGLLHDKFQVIITAVAAGGLDASWLGRQLDATSVAELVKLGNKNRFSIVGEGGEYETFVLDCPMFSKRINVLKSEKKWDKKTRSGVFDIKEIETVSK